MNTYSEQVGKKLNDLLEKTYGALISVFNSCPKLYLSSAWMDIKGFLSLDSEESMLEEAIRGEKAAVEEYQEIINDTSLPSSTRDILVSQKNKIENGLQNIKSLENIH